MITCRSIITRLACRVILLAFGLIIILLYSFCRKIHYTYTDEGRNLRIRFAETNLSYTTGDTLKVLVEFKNVGNTSLHLPIRFSGTKLEVKLDTTYQDYTIFPGTFDPPFSNIDLSYDSTVIKELILGSGETEIAKMKFLYLWNTAPYDSICNYLLYYRLEYEDSSRAVTEYDCTSENFVTITFKE